MAFPFKRGSAIWGEGWESAVEAVIQQECQSCFDKCHKIWKEHARFQNYSFCSPHVSFVLFLYKCAHSWTVITEQKSRLEVFLGKIKWRSHNTAHPKLLHMYPFFSYTLFFLLGLLRLLIIFKKYFSSLSLCGSHVFLKKVLFSCSWIPLAGISQISLQLGAGTRGIWEWDVGRGDAFCCCCSQHPGSSHLSSTLCWLDIKVWRPLDPVSTSEQQKLIPILIGISTFCLLGLVCQMEWGSVLHEQETKF